MPQCWLALFIVAVIAFAGCQPTEGNLPGSAGGSTQVSYRIEVADHLNARLAVADVLEGAEDKVISNCNSCQLVMKGKGELAAQVNDFATHFCSKGCRTRFQEDAANMIVKIES